MRNKISTHHARAFTRYLDRMANMIDKQAKTFGVPGDISDDLTFRMDYVADYVSKKANLLSDRSPKNPGEIQHPLKGGFDGGLIGEINGGPSTHLDTNETWMDDQFTQQEFSELSTRLDKNMMENPTEVDRMAAARRNASTNRRAAWEKRREEMLRQARSNRYAGEEEAEGEEDTETASKKASLDRREARLAAREAAMRKQEQQLRQARLNRYAGEEEDVEAEEEEATASKKAALRRREAALEAREAALRQQEAVLARKRTFQR